jgi:RNA polymerase sigma-70 factor (ECF subfamily)
LPAAGDQGTPPLPLDEGAVIAGIRRGSTASFEQLFRAHHPEMCAFATRMVGRTDVAEDLVQEVFLYVWRHREAWDVQTSARQYLYSSVRHAALRYLRHERVVQQHVPETVALFARSPRPTDADLSASEIVSAVRAAIERLPDRCRLVFTLHREQGMSYLEVAEVMGISPKTVDVQMGRALKALRLSLRSFRL